MDEEIKNLFKKFAEDIIKIEGVKGSDLKLQTLNNQFSLLVSLDYDNQPRSNSYGLTAQYDKTTGNLYTLFEAEN